MKYLFWVSQVLIVIGEVIGALTFLISKAPDSVGPKAVFNPSIIWILLATEAVTFLLYVVFARAQKRFKFLVITVVTAAVVGVIVSLIASLFPGTQSVPSIFALLVTTSALALPISTLIWGWALMDDKKILEV
jgi:hypothetical protein